MDLRLGFYVFGISRARRMGIDRVLIHTQFFDILPPPTQHVSLLGSEASYLKAAFKTAVVMLKIAVLYP